MTALEKAIAYFEDAIRESDEIIAECSAEIQAKLTEQKLYFEIALGAMKKQAPKLPEGVHASANMPVYLIGYCPECGLRQTISGRTYNPAYCAGCGQRLKEADWYADAKA